MRRQASPNHQKQWYSRDEVVRVGSDLGIVLACDLDGVHFVYVTRERRVVAIPGKHLNAAAQQQSIAAPDLTGLVASGVAWSH